MRAAESLRAENVAADAIHITGNTAIDAARWAQGIVTRSDGPGGEIARVLGPLAERPVALGTIHRREHAPDKLAEIGAALRTLAESDGLALMLPAHPRPESRFLTEPLSALANVAVTQPLGYFAFVRAMGAARLILTDSGGIQEEAAALGLPAVVLRNVTERSEAIDQGYARLAGSDAGAIVTAARAIKPAV